MRAVVFAELGSIELGTLTTVADPVPASNEVLIEVHAAPVNYVDLVSVSGRYQFAPSLPFTPGKGPAGVVRSVGETVADCFPGDRVLAMCENGGYAELAVADAANVYRLPGAMSFADAASMSLAFDTGWMALRERARLAAGESVLVLGASGAVGSAVVQLARAMGASTVIGTASSPEGAARVLAFGADAIVSTQGQDLRTTLRDEVLAITNGAGVDVVIDMIGADAFDGAVRALKWRGRLVVVGFTGGRIPEVKVNYLLLKNVEVSGLQISDYRKRMPGLVRAAYDEMFAMYADGVIRAAHAQVVPLAQWADALRAIDGRRADMRLVLEP